MLTAKRWFVTAPDARIVKVASSARSESRRPYEWRPVSITHAKEMGTLVTACGRVANSWPMMWEEAFRPDSDAACPQCVERVVDAEAPR